MKCTFIGYFDEKKGYMLLSDGKFIVSRDVIFYETESNILDEINHLLSCIEKKNTKGKGKKKRSKKTFWFEKDSSSPKDISLSKISSNSYDNETTKDSSDTKSSKESSPTSDISDERRDSVFENTISIIMVIQILNPLNIRSQSGLNNFSKMFIQMKLTKQELGDLQE
jgi:hypothetical protein